MNWKMSKIIVVFGATGTQGGSVARALVKDSKYTVRAVTRNVGSDKAKLLAKEGCEMVKADADDVESLKQAFVGAYGVFAVTNFWEHLDKDKEIKQGKNIVDASKSSGIKHLVYSGLDDVKSVTGKDCLHFDGKAEVERYIKQCGVPYSTVMYAAYMENLLDALKPTKMGDTFALNIPMGDIGMNLIPASECGPCVASILDKPEQYMGQQIGFSSCKLTLTQMADTLTKHLDGVKVVPGQVTTEMFASFGFPGCGDLAAMFEFYQTQKDNRDIALTKTLNPKISDFDMWVQKNKEALKNVMK